MGIHWRNCVCTRAHERMMPKRQWGPTLESKNFWCFVSVCLWRDSSCRNYPIRLKFRFDCQDVYILCEISRVVYGVQCPNSTCTGIHKSTLLKCGRSLRLKITHLGIISLIFERKRTFSHLSWFSSVEAGEFTCI